MADVKISDLTRVVGDAADADLVEIETAGGETQQKLRSEVGISAAERVKLSTALLVANIENVLTSTSTTTPLSAAQGKVLKDGLDALTTLVSSDEVTLDTLQEIVDYVQLNRTDLDALGIAGIAGLQAALDAKQATVATATTVEAEAGTETAVRMFSPALIAAAIAALAAGGGGGEAEVRGEIVLADQSNRFDNITPDGGMVRGESSGTSSAIGSTFTRGVTLDSGSSAGAYARIFTYVQNMGGAWHIKDWWSLKPIFQATFGLGGSTAFEGKLFLGMSAESTPPTTGVHAGFIVDSDGAGGYTYYASHGDGTTQTTTDVTTAIEALTEWSTSLRDQVQNLVVKCTGTSILFYMNGTLLATHTTDLPSTGLQGGVGRYAAVATMLGSAGSSGAMFCDVHYAKSTYLAIV